MGVSVEDMIRLTSDHGFCIVGASQELWESAAIFQTIEKLNQEDKIRFLSLQKIKCPINDSNSNGSQQTEILYYLSVFRKGNQIRVKMV
jgi:hypothetical protein